MGVYESPSSVSGCTTNLLMDKMRATCLGTAVDTACIIQLSGSWGPKSRHAHVYLVHITTVACKDESNAFSLERDVQ